MATTSSRNDPFAAFNFIVTIDGIKAGFSEVGGLTTETEIIEYREGNQTTTVRKTPGKTKYEPITCKRGITTDNDLYAWRKKVIEGKTQRLSGTITLLDEARNPAVVWKFYEGWPSKLEGPALNAKATDVAIYTMTIVHEGLERE